MSTCYNFPWVRLLSNYFSTVQSLDAEIEVLREELCSKASFIPSVYFNALDINKKSFLSLNDFKTVLKKMGVQFTEEGLRRFIHNFDKDNDFSIDYNEFLSMILPRENNGLKEEVVNRKGLQGESRTKDKGEDKPKESYRDKNKDIQSIEIVFTNIIQSELNLIHQLASIAEELKRSKDFTTYEAFLAIVNDDKYITETNLERFLKERNVELKGNELFTLLFRIDSDEDGKVSYEEFLEIFFPLTNSSYTQNREKDRDIRVDKDNGNVNDDDKEVIKNKDAFMKYKHGLSRYDTKTDDIMLSNTKNKQKAKESKRISINTNVNDTHHGSQRQNIFQRQASMKNIKEEKYNDKDKEKYIEKEDLNIKPNILKRNSQLRDKDQENGSLMNDCITPSRQQEQQLPHQRQLQRHRAKQIQLEAKERLNQTYQSEYSCCTPLPSKSKPKLKKVKSNILTFDRNKARYHIRTTPKAIPIPIPKSRQNGFTDDDIDNDEDLNHTCCGMNSQCSCCNCCQCHPCCKTEKTKRDLLFNLLKALVTNDTSIEEIKAKIAFDKNITIKSLFEFFDDEQRDYISKADILNKLKRKPIELMVSFDDINVLFDLYDKDNDGLLNYAEFSDLILPKKFETAKMLNERRQSTSEFTFNCFKGSNMTMQLLGDLFSIVIESEIDNEKNKEQLLSVCSIEDSFNVLKKRYSSVIYQDDINEFMEENGLPLIQDELDLLFERFDMNQDGLINLEEYTTALSFKVKGNGNDSHNEI